ncbi:MAG: glycosyltransferase family 9 protein [Limisphaerales bacterium]
MKPKLLIVELWGVGDLVIATPFLRAASEHFDATLLAKPFALDLQPRFWPNIKIMAFTAPWTAFQRKYHLWRWPWLEIARLRRQLTKENFEFGLSARWDPRDHLLLSIFGAQARLGFPRAGSRVFLTQALTRPNPASHRFESWRAIASSLNIQLPPGNKIAQPIARGREIILVHTGAGQSVRVWPLERYQRLVARLRRENYQVQIACDADQRAWWLQAGEPKVATPATVKELLALTDNVGAFVGNDSGPGASGGALRHSDIYIIWPATAGMVCAAASGSGVDRRQGMSLQALLRLLPISRTTLFVEYQRGRSLGACEKIRTDTGAKSNISMSPYQPAPLPSFLFGYLVVNPSAHIQP